MLELYTYEDTLPTAKSARVIQPHATLLPVFQKNAPKHNTVSPGTSTSTKLSGDKVVKVSNVSYLAWLAWLETKNS